MDTVPHGEGDVRDHVNTNYDPDSDNQIENVDSETIQDIVGALVAGGSNVTVNYDDNNDTLTVSATDSDTIPIAIETFELGTGEIGDLNLETNDDAIFVVVLGRGVGVATYMLNYENDTSTLISSNSNSSGSFDDSQGTSSISLTFAPTPAIRNETSLTLNVDIRYITWGVL